MLLSPPKKSYRCEYYCRKAALRTISRSYAVRKQETSQSEVPVNPPKASKYSPD